MNKPEIESSVRRKMDTFDYIKLKGLVQIKQMYPRSEGKQKIGGKSFNF